MLLVMAAALSAGTVNSTYAQQDPACKKECCKKCSDKCKDKCSKEDCTKKCEEKKTCDKQVAKG